MKAFIWACAGGCVAAAMAASAQEQVAQRHTGAFLRPDLGVGYIAMSTSDDASLSGIAETFGVAAGASISENSILALHVWEAVARNPSLSMGGVAGTGTSTATLLAIGPEYTAYSKGNFFFSISPALTRITVETNGTSGATNWGLGMRASLGKEWWAGEHWGLGLVGQLSLSLNEDSGPNAPTWTTWATTVSFSATYN
jgi:hypothetical protein